MAHVIVHWRIEEDPTFGQISVHIVGTNFGSTPGAVKVSVSGDTTKTRTMFAKILSWTDTRIIIDATPGLTYSLPQIILPDGHNVVDRVVPKMITARALSTTAPDWTLTHTSNDTTGIRFHGTMMNYADHVIFILDEVTGEEAVAQIIHASDTELVVAYPKNQKNPIPRAILLDDSGYVKQTVVAKDMDLRKDDPTWRGWIIPSEIQAWQPVRLPDGQVVINLYGVGLGDTPGRVTLYLENETPPA